jgi:hypothetical protein
MSEDLWMLEYEQIAEDFARYGDEDDYRSRMKRLGFDPDEIEEHLEALQA